jgi:UDP-2-acetamido-2-deoxy-ribo-hexuluronate aminotransferase
MAMPSVDSLGPISANAVADVPFFSQAGLFAEIWPDVAAQVNDVADRGKFSHGHKVAEFERALARYTGARHVVAVNSGTDALVLLLRAAGLRRGQPVVVPAFSFVASASSVVLAGGRVVFADIEPGSYGIDPAEVDRVASAGGFVMPVHLFCQLADLAGVLEIAHRRDLTVVEDSAEAIGMRHNGVHAGLHGLGGTLSFFPSKTLGALGDAGAVVTDDPQIAETVAALRHHGRFGRTLANFPGIANATAVSGVNSKMDDIQAAVLLVKLARLEADIARRAELAAAYDERLRDVPGVLRVPTVVTRQARARAVFYVYVIEVERRDELAAHLAARGIGTEIYYPRPLHLQPCFQDLGHTRGDFPVAEAVCRRSLALPLYPGLSLADVDRVCGDIRAFFAGGRP